MSAAGAEVNHAQRLLDDGIVARLLAALTTNSHHARIVGGAVRNALIGRAISDIDICTSRLPAETIEAAEQAGWKAVPTGIAHGTVTIIIAGRAFEVTTLREDIATDGRHAVVRFGTSFEADAARRDFTINAMSLSPDGTLHDYFGGLADLAARRVRFIGEADQRLREDYLRGLRFLRFSAEYGDGSLDPEGLAAVIRNRDGFAGLSAERIRQEMLKLIVAPFCIAVMEEAEQTGLLSQLLGGDVDIARLSAVNTEQARLGLRALQPVEALFALAICQSSDVRRLQYQLRLSNAETSDLDTLTIVRENANLGATLRHLAFLAPSHVEILPGLLPGPIWTENSSIASVVADLIDNPPHFMPSGADVMARGLSPGPMIGRVLEGAERLWIAADLPDDRTLQFACLDQAIETISKAT